MKKIDMLVPHRPIANMRYRDILQAWAAKSPANQQWIKEKSAEDFLWWVTSFAWLIEPRPEPGKSALRPFLPWPSQLKLFEVMTEAVGHEDILIEKARGEGATWSVLYYFVYRWLFSTPLNPVIFGIVSRNEKVADSPDDPSSIGAKMDWALAMLPAWMRGEFTRNKSKHTWIRHPGAGPSVSSMTAVASTADLFAGGRATCILMDEFARFGRGKDERALSASEAATNSRIILSTHAGADNAYAKALSEMSSARRVVMKWEDNPTRNANIFTISPRTKTLVSPTGDPIAVDYSTNFFENDLPILQQRGFDVDDTRKLWSPWYVERCLRPRMSQRKIAQEYDRDVGSSGDSVFSASMIHGLRQFCHPPLASYDVIVDERSWEVAKLVKSRTGKLKTWSPFRVDDRRPTPANYVLGVDIGTGLGRSHASNSAIEILNARTGVQIAEYADATITPGTFAELVVALANFYRSDTGAPAFVLFENNGPGGGFAHRLAQLPFSNLYRNTVMGKLTRKPTKELGFRTSAASKRTVLLNLAWSLQEGFIQVSSEAALDECLCYNFGAGDAIVFRSGGMSEEAMGALGANHADRAFALALACHGVSYLGIQEPAKRDGASKKSKTAFPPGSYGFRKRQRAKARRGLNNNKWYSKVRADGESIEGF